MPDYDNRPRELRLRVARYDEAQSAFLYDRSFKRKESASNWLKLGSIGAAVLTALSTRLPGHNPDLTLAVDPMVFSSQS